MGGDIKDFSIKIVTSADLKAAQDSAKALQDVGQAASAATTEQVKGGQAAADAGRDIERKLTPEVKEATHSLHDKRAILMGLRDTFPTLVPIAHAAFHPIMLLGMALGGAFEIMSHRIKEAARAITEIALPDISPAKVGQVTAMAEAWKGYKEALEGAVRAYGSVEGAAGRAMKRLDEEAAGMKRLLEARKGLELADLESKKTTLSESEYERQKLGIEARYERAGVKAEEFHGLDRAGLMREEAGKLRRDADQKLKESAGIKVGTAEQDAGTLEDLKKRADEAEKDIKERKENVATFRALQEGELGPIDAAKAWIKLRTSLGLPFIGPTAVTDDQVRQAIGQEQTVITSEQANVDRYNARLRAQSSRKEQQERKQRLAKEAGDEFGKAGVLDAEAMDLYDSTEAEAKVGGQVSNTNERARLLQALGKAREEVKQDQEAMLKAMEHSTGLAGAVVDKMAEHAAALADLEKRLRTVEGRPPRN